MIICRIGPVWYMSSKGDLRRCNELVEDLGKWEIVPSAELEQVKGEFGASIMKDIQALAPSESEPIREVALEDPVAVAKFDSWHALVTSKKTIISKKEDLA